MMQSSNKEEREEGEKSFTENDKKYGLYFDSIKKKLPSKFIKQFYEKEWFHDYKITNLQISNEKKVTARIDIEKSEDKFSIVLSDVQTLLFDIPNKTNWMLGKLTWGYTEFELKDNKYWIVRILCDFNCELEVHFKSISCVPLE